MIAQLTDILNRLGMEPTAREIAEALFLALHITPTTADGAAEKPRLAEAEGKEQQTTLPAEDSPSSPQLPPKSAPKPDELYLKRPDAAPAVGGIGATGVRVASAIALPGARGIGKALRPLLQTYPSRTRQEIDLDRTIQAMAETGTRMVVCRPAPERRLEAALVVDEGETMRVWHPTVREFQRLLERQGAFRSVRAWGMNADDGTPKLYNRIGRVAPPVRLRDPRELLDAEGRRVIFVLSDCHSAGWKNGAAFELLARWGERTPVLLVQLLPQRMWELAAMPPVNAQLRAAEAGLPNRRLQPNRPAPKNAMPMPVVMLEDWAIALWAQMLAARGKASVKGFLIPRPWPVADPDPEESTWERTAQADFARLPEVEQARLRIADFKAAATAPAFRLAGYLAAVKLNFPVMRLVQQAMMPESRQSHLAEVLLGGLIRRSGNASAQHPDEVLYKFHPGVDELLLAPEEGHTDPRETLRVVAEISRLIENRLPFADEFRAMLTTAENQPEERIAPGRSAFATISPVVVRRFFGARSVEEESEAEAAKLLVDTADIDPSEQQLDELQLSSFEFETLTLGVRGKEIKGSRRKMTARQFVENLDDGVTLEMVEIPGGKFVRGAPNSEKDSYPDERPQREVTIAPFYLGKFTVTQKQWRVVAGWEKVERELDPNPAYFKDRKDSDDRPVEQVSWLDAKEFCARLSKRTGRSYRLPSEAEWEYACRAGTTTPFAFGETITPEIVNYNGNYPYAKAKKGKYRGETVPVGSLGPANAFGLFDMHGNVWEWCEDVWQDNYQNTPTDGSAWLSDKDSTSHVLRGGSWDRNGLNCRSAYRGYDEPDVRNYGIGFRVVVGARTP